VVTCKGGEVRAVDGEGAHARDLIGREGHAQSRAADEDPAVGRTGTHATCGDVGEVGIVHPIVSGRAKILDLVTKPLTKAMMSAF